jgi:hypothetical protein
MAASADRAHAVTNVPLKGLRRCAVSMEGERDIMRKELEQVEGGFTVVPRILILGALLSVVILPVHGSAAMGVVVPSSEASQAVVIQDVTR